MPLHTVPSAETAETVDRYRSTHGFDDVYVNGRNQIVVPAGRTVDAIQMSRRLGDRVQSELDRLKLPTPIIHNRRTEYLMFLTSAAPPADHAAARLTGIDDGAGERAETASQARDVGLFRNMAIRTFTGATITLPGPEDAIRVWLVPPVDCVRADFDAVARVTVELGDRLRR